MLKEKFFFYETSVRIFGKLSIFIRMDFLSTLYMYEPGSLCYNSDVQQIRRHTLQTVNGIRNTAVALSMLNTRFVFLSYPATANVTKQAKNQQWNIQLYIVTLVKIKWSIYESVHRKQRVTEHRNRPTEPANMFNIVYSINFDRLVYNINTVNPKCSLFAWKRSITISCPTKALLPVCVFLYKS